MIELVPKPSVPFYRHTVDNSCVMIARGQGSSKSFVIRREDLKDFDALANELKLALSSLNFSQVVLMGTEQKLSEVSGVVKALKVADKLTLRKLENGDFIMVDPRSGRAKLQQFGKKSQAEEVNLPGVSASAVRAANRVLVVDDSPTMLKMLDNILKSDASLEVAALVETAEDALQYIEGNSVDVITLDLNLPQMDGVQFLKECHKREISIPTVVITSMNMNDGDKVFDALQNGAVDYIQKPDAGDMEQARQVILEKVKGAASANLEVIEKPAVMRSEVVSFSGNEIDMSPIFIGSSTGGTSALERMLSQFTPPVPPIAIVQHIPPVFSKAFADRLNALFPFEVKEAQDGDEMKVNRVLIAPGGLQMGVKPWRSGHLQIVITDDMPVNRFKPSVDFLFESVSINYAGPKLAVILTGMGRDGAAGMKSMKDSSQNIVTIAQNKESSVVYGMPKAAVDLGCVDIVCHLDEIPEKIKESLLDLKRKTRKSA
ncbi:MAG: chemotaxis-specific protein-glutamate methyltransferase CheB [Pseudomonadota bacterium]